jgi:hypothetical protein
MKDPLSDFGEVWLEDTEFGSESGEPPKPRCSVAQEFRSKRIVRQWWHGPNTPPPFELREDTLYVAYFASAEIGYYLECGWPLPKRILDPYVEFRNLYNCLPTYVEQKVCLEDGKKIGRNSLHGATIQLGLPTIGVGERPEVLDLIKHDEHSREEKQVIFSYCEGHVLGLERLFAAMLPRLDVRRAVYRGDYMRACAIMERNGIGIDGELLHRVRTRWSDIQQELIVRIDAPFGVFEGTVFRTEKFERHLAEHGIPWERYPDGRVMLDEQTFRDMCKLYPQFNPLRELRSTLSKMRLNKLAVGSDGRNRTILSPYRAITSRSQPSSSKYIFGPDTVWRGFIKPPPGHATAYIDYRSQEFGVAAAKSGDEAMQADYNSGDVYLSFAKAAGLVPADATKVSHPDARELAKLIVLGIGYGMGEQALAFRINRHVLVARSLLRRYRERYWRYEEWANNRVRGAMLAGLTHTVFGWLYHITPNVNVRSVRNFPVQGNAAEILRLAVCLGIENGIKICGPVHDAVLIESPLDEIESDVARMRACMGRASEIVLDGFKLVTDYVVVRYPDRYMDPRGRQFWDTIMSLL